MCAASPGVATSSDRESLFQRDWFWQTDAGKPLRLSELTGHPIAMAMFFTTCSGTCGVTVDHMLQIDASLTSQERKQTRFVLVTFDSENDTPHVLEQYRAQRRLPAEWILLHGSAESTRELAAQLAVKFAPDAARHILHGAQITVINTQGQIALRAAGVNTDLNPVLTALRSQFSTAPALVSMIHSPQ